MAALTANLVPLARVLAPPLMITALWTTVIERPWYRIFPALVMVFAALLIAGYVSMGWIEDT